jgi:hypothetical protein
MGVGNCFSFLSPHNPYANPSGAMAAATADHQLHPWAEHETMFFQQPAQDRAQSSRVFHGVISEYAMRFQVSQTF